MGSVPQHVLNWLHSALLPEYQDVNRTYSDVAKTLANYTGLKPSTTPYTFENGRSYLLLRLAGLIPVSYRGTPYHFPFVFYIPQSYPADEPISWVDPTPDMSVRPGQHVSVEGRIYHPYLASWSDRSDITEFIRLLQEAFAREPPMVARRSQPRGPLPSQQQNGSIPPPRPPLPQELGRQGSSGQYSPQTSSSAQPPPPPPKPHAESRRSEALTPNDPPPVPPHPGRETHSRGYQSPGEQQAPNPRYSAPPPLPQQEQQGPSSVHDSQRGRLDSRGNQSPQVSAWVQEQAQQLQFPPGRPPTGPPQPQAIPYNQQQHQTYPPHYANQQPQPRYTQTPIYQQPQPQQPPQTSVQPPPDLLTSPFDPQLPTQSSPAPAPPIPPNPEKDALLSAISHSLTTQLHSTLASNNSALLPLQAQHSALQSALSQLNAEQAALSHLSSTLTQNEAILHTAMRDADAIIARAKDMPVPHVDEVLVAPTLLGQQMYELVAEELACREARDVLGRGLDRGRIGLEGWVKATRGLAREEFLKKWLIRKGAVGMGLGIQEG